MKLTVENSGESAFALMADKESLFPLLVNRYGFSLVGVFQIEVPESDFEENFPLPFGHAAFIDEGETLWVCRIYLRNALKAHLTVTWRPAAFEISAVHDFRMEPSANAVVLRELIASLTAGRVCPLKIVALDAEQVNALEEIGPPVRLDPYCSTSLSWSDYAL